MFVEYTLDLTLEVGHQNEMLYQEFITQAKDLLVQWQRITLFAKVEDDI